MTPCSVAHAPLSKNKAFGAIFCALSPDFQEEGMTRMTVSLGNMRGKGPRGHMRKFGKFGSPDWQGVGANMRCLWKAEILSYVLLQHPYGCVM